MRDVHAPSAGMTAPLPADPAGGEAAPPADAAAGNGQPLRAEGNASPPEPPSDFQSSAEAPSVPVEVESHFWLRRADQVALGVVILAALALMALHWVRLSGWGTQTVEIDRHASRVYDYRFDVNAATWIEWLQLPGIGETLARRILDDREANGPFTSIDDLQRVHGIGPKTVENIRPWLTVSETAP